MTKSIYVSFMPGTPVQIVFEDAITVAEAIKLSGLNPKGYVTKVDGAEVSMDSAVPATARFIVLAKKVKGNAECLIQVSYMPGTPVPFLFDTPKTVKEILAAVGMDSKGYVIKLDGREVALEDTITSGRFLVLAKKVKGNI